MNDDAMNEIVQEFLVETNENLDQLDQDLVALESDPHSRQLLGSIFRTIHTVKGTTGFLGFGRLEGLSHAAESLLSELRDGKLELNRVRTDILLEVVDEIRVLLATIEQTGADGGGDLSDLISRIELLQLPDAPSVEPEPAEALQAEPDPAPLPAVALQQETAVPVPAQPEPVPAAAVAVESVPVPVPAVVAVPVCAVVAEPEPVSGDDAEPEPVPAAAFAHAVEEDPGPFPAVLAEAEPVPPSDDQIAIDMQDVLAAQAVAAAEALLAARALAAASSAEPATAPGPRPGPPADAPAAAAVSAPPAGDTNDSAHGDTHRLAADRSVRVDVDLLDAMMSQVGELVLARNQVSAHLEQIDNQALHQTVQRLSMIVSELQSGVMKTRMQAVEQLWAKLPRVVRDLSAQLSKRVSLEMDGGETELDRSLLEAVKDPLTHLVRNAIDHAIELPAVRVAAGKPPTGTLLLRAFNEGGQIVLEVADDGAGIDPAKIGAKGVERGLLTQAELESMNEREIVNLIFRAGFSTAEAVTNVSGRGVGMDVVRTNVERIGGTVDLTSTPGVGTTFRIKIPLTLAIIPALLVGCRGQRYAIPQSNLLEMVQLQTHGEHSEIERIGDALVYRLRGKLLPLVRLDEILGYAAVHGEVEPDAANVVVLQADGRLLGVVVDDVFGTEEIVVKPLGQHVKHVPLFAGATIMGDGSVALILDVIGLATSARVHDVSSSLGSVAALVEDSVGRIEHRTFVLLRVGRDRRVAVPLKAVSRLEEAAADAIERAGDSYVMQYRDDLLPLVTLTSILGEAEDYRDPDDTDPKSGSVPVVVYTEGGRSLGLVASEVLDIVEGMFEIRSVGASSGVLGSTVVHGRVTDVLDVEAVFNQSIREVADVY